MTNDYKAALFVFSVQITFRQKWQDDRLTYMNRLTKGDMKGKTFQASLRNRLISGKLEMVLSDTKYHVFYEYKNVQS